jgi:hypothetical protein
MVTEIKVSTNVHGRKIVAKYYGGPYIDLLGLSRSGHMEAFECVNVWDYEKGQPTIEFSHNAVRGAIREWSKEITSEDLHNYLDY